MPDPLYRYKFLRPELFLAELIKKSAQGQIHDTDKNLPFLFRAVVVAVDVNGGQLENPTANGSVSHTVNGQSFTVPATQGPLNPRNSIKARVINEGFDQVINDDRLKVFWPFFPEHISVPIKPGEFAYVIFEDPDYEHGLWISKVPGQENFNYFPGQSSFHVSGQNSKAAMFGDSTNNSADQQEATDDAATQSSPDGGLSKLFGDS